VTDLLDLAIQFERPYVFDKKCMIFAEGLDFLRNVVARQLGCEDDLAGFAPTLDDFIPAPG